MEAARHKVAAVRPLTNNHEKLPKLDVAGMQNNAGEVGTNS